MDQDDIASPHVRRRMKGTPSAPSLLSVFVLLLVALLWAAALSYVGYAREQAVEAIKRETANLAIAFEEHTVRTIKQMDQITLLLKRAFETRGPRPDLSRLSWEARFKPEFVLVIAVADERGEVVASNVPIGQVNLGDREHFLRHKARDSGQLDIAKPMLGRVAGKWVIPMSRRINRPDGSFGGIVVVGVDPFYFSNFYKRIDLGRLGVVSLYGRDGIIRSRRSGLDEGVGQDVSKGAMFRQMMERAEGSIQISGVIDQVPRIYSYHSLGEYPLAVAVGIAEIEALAEVRHRKRYVYGAAAAMSAFILSFSFWLLMVYRKDKQSESEIRRLNRDLVKHASEVEAANQELEAFSHSIAHDLRSPLRAMDGFGSILRSEHGLRLDEEGHRLLQKIIDAARRMSELIDGLLSLPRLGHAALERASVDLSTCAREVMADLAQRDPARRVSWRIEDRVLAQGDPELLRALVGQLLENAWKFTSKRDLASIEFGTTRDAHGRLVYFVRDDGAGFDMAYSQHLFQPFQRLHHVSDYPGTGIGLAAAERIIRRHGGRVWAEGAPDRGATFYFTLSSGSL